MNIDEGAKLLILIFASFLIVFTIIAGLIAMVRILRKNDSDNKTPEEIPEERVPLDAISRIEFSTKVLQFIQFTILTIVDNELSEYTMLHENYPMKNIDTDVKIISEKVYKAIEPNFYSMIESFYTKEFIMTYIVTSTKKILIEAVRKINAV